jgi:hypothetical protein
MKLRATIRIEEDYIGRSVNPFWKNLKYGDVVHVCLELDSRYNDLRLHKNNEIKHYYVTVGNFKIIMRSLKHTVLEP